MRIYIKPNTREALASAEKQNKSEKRVLKELFAPPLDLDMKVRIRYNSDSVDEEFEDLEERYGPEEGP